MGKNRADTGLGMQRLTGFAIDHALKHPTRHDFAELDVFLGQHINLNLHLNLTLPISNI